VIAPLPPDEPPAETAPPAEPVRRAPRRVAPRAEAGKAASSVPAERKAEAPEKPETAEAPKRASQEAAPPGLLQMTPPGNQAQVDRHIRDLLTRAAYDLTRIDYAALNGDGKAQYDTAKRFIQQAEQALKDRNFPFAAKLADKAGALAAILVRR
jgi:uncharacterized protein (DUF885 family)